MLNNMLLSFYRSSAFASHQTKCGQRHPSCQQAADDDRDEKEALEKSSDRWGHVVSIRITFNSSEQHMVAFTSMYILNIYIYM